MNKKDIPITACIIAQNEEKYIAKAINNLMPNVAEVIVIDGGSSDTTIKLSQSLGARVNCRDFKYNFSSQRNYAMSLCQTEWVLFCDADEWFSEEFYTILPTLITQPPDKCMGYHVHRISTFDNEKVGEDFQWRVLNKNGGFWSGKVHEGFTFYRGYKGIPLSKEYVLYHEHTMKRQLYNNALYFNINNNIDERPADTKGMEYQKDKWIEVPTGRDD